MIKPITAVTKDLLDDFDCGKDELNLYLKKYALQNNDKNLSKTFVLTEKNKIIGYYSLSNAQIGFDHLTEEMKKRLPKYPVPAIRLARLAVVQQEQGKGYGSALLKDAFLRTLKVAEHTGVCFVVVDAKEEAKMFYEKFGFLKLSGFLSTYVLSVSTIVKAIGRKKEN